MRVASRLLLVFFIPVLALDAHAVNVGWLSELPEGVVLHRTKAGVIDESGWCDAVSFKGSFQVKLPVTFEDWSAVIAPDDLLTHSVGGTSVDGIVMLATEFPVLDSIGAYDIKQITQSLFADVAGVRVRYFNLRDMDVSQARFKKDGRHKTVRHIVTGEKLFRLSIDYPIKHQRKARKMEKMFFLSFRLKVEKPLADF